MTEYKWYKLPLTIHTMKETSKLIELIKEKHNPDRLNIQMKKISNKMYSVKIYLRKIENIMRYPDGFEGITYDEEKK